MTSENNGKYVGKRIPRKEDPKFLRGRGQYVDDLQRPGMLHLAFTRSTVAHANIESIDIKEAEKTPGVIGVYTASDLASLVKPIFTNMDNPNYQACAWPVLADGKVNFSGEAVAVVAAQNRYQAEDGANAVFWDFEELPCLIEVEDSVSENAPQIHPEVPGNRFLHFKLTDGDIAGAFAKADCTLDFTLRCHRAAPLYMEPRATIAEWGTDGSLSVWASLQAPHLFRSGLSQFTGVPESKIRVISPDVGGGFGAKMVLYPEDLCVVAIAKILDRPVKWTSDRYEDLLVGVHGRDQVNRLQVAASKNGQIMAIKADVKSNNGAYPPWPVTAGMDAGQAAAYMPGPYKIDCYEREISAVVTNKAPLGPYRGIGRVQACISMERIMDEVARKLDMEPLEVRRKNIVREYPYENISGFTYECGSSAVSLDKIEELVDIPAFRKEQREMREKGVYRGIGFAASVEHAAFGPEFASTRGIDVVLSNEAALVRVEPDGGVTVLVGTHSHGQGHETTFAQVVADDFGIPMDLVTIRFGDTAMSPYGMGTWGSRSLIYATGAISKAISDIKDKAIAIASKKFEVSPDDLEFTNGEVRVRGMSDRTLTLADAGRIAHHQSHLVPDDDEPGLESQRNYQAPDPGTFADSLHAGIVEIDIETGSLKILRYVVVEDCGAIVNPLIADGQAFGAVVQGLGQALLEDVVYSDDGTPQSVTLADYLLPTANDVPDIEMHHLETLSPQIPGGYKGMAEGGCINSPAAIANAVADALSPFEVLVDRMPITPDWIREQVCKARGST